MGAASGADSTSLKQVLCFFGAHNVCNGWSGSTCFVAALPGSFGQWMMHQWQDEGVSPPGGNLAAICKSSGDSPDASLSVNCATNTAISTLLRMVPVVQVSGANVQIHELLQSIISWFENNWKHMRKSVANCNIVRISKVIMVNSSCL